MGFNIQQNRTGRRSSNSFRIPEIINSGNVHDKSYLLMEYIETGTPPVWKGKKNYAKGGKGSRKWWLQYLKQK